MMMYVAVIYGAFRVECREGLACLVRTVVSFLCYYSNEWDTVLGLHWFGSTHISLTIIPVS
ncbi:hypothetical protein BDQ17DRAFT_770843 [Cyathus striatus]|nr:hypothetical protein BDQ17DRAFT_1290337 [Cyathus striatus]KAF8998951.1 hypothetical protein BDQ17DRAFT_770843 [Cyathus striatus]